MKLAGYLVGGSASMVENEADAERGNRLRRLWKSRLLNLNAPHCNGCEAMEARIGWG